MSKNATRGLANLICWLIATLLLAVLGNIVLIRPSRAMVFATIALAYWIGAGWEPATRLVFKLLTCPLCHIGGVLPHCPRCGSKYDPS